MPDGAEPRATDVVVQVPVALFQLQRRLGEPERFAFVSAQITELLALDPRALEAESAALWALLSPTDAVRVAESLELSAAQLSLWETEFQARLPAGPLKWIAALARPVRMPDGAVVWHGYLRDATEHRRGRQVDKMNAIARLAGGIAHDLNNLLTAVGSNLDMAANEMPLDHAAQRYLEQSRHAANRAADLTRELVAFSRRQVLKLQLLQLNDVVTRAQMAGRLLPPDRADLVLDVRLDPAGTTVRADPDQLEQILSDLVANAADAMPSGGTITIATGCREIGDAEARSQPGMRAGRHAWLSVRDTGQGFNEQVQAHLFEPFFTTKVVHGASAGLGLAAAYGSVKQLDGYIEVASTPARGTTFTVYLPEVVAASDEPSGRDMEPQAAAKAPSARARISGSTVLIAEDESSVREPVRRVLERFGYRVIDAPDGGTALALAAETGNAIDLLLTDVVMPGMSGSELARRLREQQPAVRVLFMSGYSSEAIATHGMLAPGSAFLQKPFSLTELLDRVRDVLAGTAA